MSNAAGMWEVGEAPKDGRSYLCWCTFNYGGGREIVSRPVVLYWSDEAFNALPGWEWDDNESGFWGTIEFYARIEKPK